MGRTGDPVHEGRFSIMKCLTIWRLEGRKLAGMKELYAITLLQGAGQTPFLGHERQRHVSASGD